MNASAACDQPSPLLTHSSHALSSPMLELDTKESAEGLTLEALRKQMLDKASPEEKYMKYQSPGKPDMLHQLLVQRTFSPHDEKLEPRTSSPVRKVRAFADNCGCSPIRSTPSSACSSTKEPSQQASKIVPFVLPRVENAMPTHDLPTIFKTPIRAQHRNGDNNGHSTPSRQTTMSLFSSPAGSSSCLFTPGRHFVNPFEIDSERLHMPAYSPSIFKVGSTSTSTPNNDSEGFWSVDQAALMMPVTIKDSDVQRQLRHQQKIDREQDDKVQAAINAFFSNELIVPSPWSEKVHHFLPRTPGSLKSVSCQTTLSVPPGVDLLTELGGKYELPESKADPSPPVDAMGNSFIRRKLLNQLNDNDILSSPELPQRALEKTSSSPPCSGMKQSTPEWEQQTPNKQSSGHFSSSPIHEEPDERGHHPALSESELLASPELSPVSGSGSNRFSGVYYSDQDMENPRAIMQLDFSSILEDDSGDEEETINKQGSLMQQAAVDNQPSIELSSCFQTSVEPQLQAFSMSSQDGESLPVTDPNSCRPVLDSGLSVESASDTVSCSTSGPNSGSSQDMGYHTTSLLQSTTNLAISSSNSMQIDGGVSTVLDPFIGSNKTMSDTTQPELTGIKHKTDSSINLSCLSPGIAVIEKSSDMPSLSFDGGLPRKRERCLVRKVRALSDVRLTREKRSVSRDLTQSFNMNCSSKSDEIRSSLCDIDNKATKSSVSREKLDGLDVGNTLDVSMHSINSSDISSYPVKTTMASLSTPGLELVSNSVQQSSNKNYTKEYLELVSNSVQQSSNKNYTKEYLEQKELHTTDTYFQSKISLGGDDTLEQARQLLGKSEQLRQRHLQLEQSKSETFCDVLMASDENVDPSQSSSLSGAVTLDIRKAKSDDWSPTPVILENIEKNINSVQSTRLGSEIAEEILKRAVDDLTKVTDNLSSSLSPRWQEL